tara:strand:+ start:1225 stop:1680 length:456 start_codon:yes stop_codon:yes gene_type:complete
MSVSGALRELKRDQLLDILRQAKKLTQIKIANESRPQLISMALELHGTESSPNKYKGKQLFGLTKGQGHILLPAREVKQLTTIKRKEKAATTAKNKTDKSLTARLADNRTEREAISINQMKLAKLKTQLKTAKGGELAVVEAKLRRLAKSY